MPSYYGRIENPFRDALSHLMSRRVPKKLVPDLCANSNDPRIDQHKLQDWVNTHMPSGIYWSTGIGIIEAADHIVEEADANANIDPLPLEPLRPGTKAWVRSKKKR